ncbi:MAG: RNA polymerase sigma factor [Deltaproteobacteria bacterium]|nr:RNA polymerase sigma factor [Deltaproteobacteria bacterium]
MLDVSTATWLARERQLVDRSRAGDHRAFHELYDAFAPMLLAVLSRRGLAHADADDVAADTFKTAWESLARHSSDRSIWFWLHGIAINKAAERRRTAGRQNAKATELGSFADDTDPPDLEAALDFPKHVSRLHTTLPRLPENYRTALQLRVADSQPRETCAQAMGLTLAAFDKVCARAILALKELWHE